MSVSWALRAAFIVLVMAAGCCASYAHDSWISRDALRNARGEWCCGEGDCFVVPGGNVTIVPAGYRVRWDAVIDGKDATGVEIVPYSEAQPSRDGQFWRCKRPDGSRRCFFAPPPAI